jgi:pentapeptide repeat protein/NACHT domain-containing protein
VDPVSTVGIGVLSKLIGLGIKGWSALDDRDFNKEDVEALRTLLDTGASVSDLRKPAAANADARHLALIGRSFGRAVGRHQEFHGKLLLTKGLRRWLNRADREREEEIKQRVQFAALRVRELGNDPRAEIEHISSLTEHPLATPYYRALWQAFSDPGLTIEDAGDDPPLVMSTTARREFERYFLLAYLEGIAAPASGGIEEYLEGLKQYRATLVRDLLVRNLATWGNCHVFGNVPRESWDESDVVPFMPLDGLYVEPSGAVDRDGKRAQKEPSKPLLALIESLTVASAAPKVVVVAADFGSGKSLSARMLARRWAEQFLSSPAVSLDLPLPIHVRCAEDFPSETVDLELTVRRAWKRQADSMGYSVSDDDGAFAWPTTEQHVVCLLDGLDEVALGEQHLKTLFQKLGAKTTRNHRFVIFSRPGALPAAKDLGDHIVVVRVQPFNPDQVEQWLGGWNQLRAEHPAVTRPALADRNLEAVAQTPILLFMVAFAWNYHATASEPPSLAEIYEHFFYQVAAGKAEADREQHRPIGVASEALLAALKTASILDDSAEQPDAMLWLMGRVAWEAHMLEQRQPPQSLTRRHVDNLLQDGDVPIPSGAADTIRLGLILALQADLHSANHTILFGHQSFREFLVGRHWALLLQRVVRNRGRNDRLTESLVGGRLLGGNNKSFDFLMTFINTTAVRPPSASPLTWNDSERESLVRWAQEIFEDEHLEFGERARPNRRAEVRLRNDLRAELREAALAIGSMTKNSKGLRAGDPLTLRSMLAWFWLQSVHAHIIAPGAHFSRAELGQAELNWAKLAGADLGGAALMEAQLIEADLTGADLSGAVLIGARLIGTKLCASDLREAEIAAATILVATSSGTRRLTRPRRGQTASLHLPSLSRPSAWIQLPPSRRGHRECHAPHRHEAHQRRSRERTRIAAKARRGARTSDRATRGNRGGCPRRGVLGRAEAVARPPEAGEGPPRGGHLRAAQPQARREIAAQRVAAAVLVRKRLRGHWPIEEPAQWLPGITALPARDEQLVRARREVCDHRALVGLGVGGELGDGARGRRAMLEAKIDHVLPQAARVDLRIAARGQHELAVRKRAIELGPHEVPGAVLERLPVHRRVDQRLRIAGALEHALEVRVVGAVAAEREDPQAAPERLGARAAEADTEHLLHGDARRRAAIDARRPRG